MSLPRLLSMICQHYIVSLCSVVIVTILFYLLFGNQYFDRLKSAPVSVAPYANINANVYSASRRVEEPKEVSTIGQNLTSSSSQIASYPYYPGFPVLLYTHFSQKLTQAAKLILLGNGFFGDSTWSLGAMGKSPKALMTSLMCPYLAHYCDITADQQFLSSADAVVFHARDEIDLKRAQRDRQPEQRFVFALWESPAHTPSLKAFRRFFNWTMTYRLTSHVVASYYSKAYLHTSSDYYKFLIRENITDNPGSTFPKLDHRPSDDVLAEKKLGTVAALISNMGGTSRRLPFIKHLKQHIDVTVYGKESTPCPANGNCLEFIAKNYYFYLSFENSLCQDYTTEKFFGVLQYPIVPVVLGFSNYSHFIPSSGFIDTEDFANITALARFMTETRADKEKYLSYFAWKKDYVWNRHQSLVPFCDLCLRLHLDSTPNVIDDIHSLWHENTCRAPRRLAPLKRLP